MKQITNNYDQQAIDFLTTTNCEFSATFLKHAKHFDDDKEERDIYSVTLKRGNRRFTFNFGQSLSNSGFYYTTGKRKVAIDRKYLTIKNLQSTIRMRDSSFIIGLDKIVYPVAPTAYDVLASLTKCDVGGFEDFCSEFGYNEDSKKADKTYQAVLNEYTQLCALFTDAEMQQLQEIN